MSNELIHYGVPGMKWGVRRYQNKDGSLTNAGKKRQMQLEKQASKYDKLVIDDEKEYKRSKKEYDDIVKNGTKSKYYEKHLNPDEPTMSVKNAKRSAEMDVNYYRDSIKLDKAVAESIRSTPFGKKSIEEISKQKDVISKGTSAAIAASGIAVTSLLKNKKYISTGSAVVGVLMSGAAATMHRYKTYQNVYDELRERK